MTDKRYDEIIGMTPKKFWAQPDRFEFIVRRDSGAITAKHQQINSATRKKTFARERALCFSTPGNGY